MCLFITGIFPDFTPTRLVYRTQEDYEIEGRRFHAEESEQDAITGFTVFPFFKLPKKVRNHGA